MKEKAYSHTESVWACLHGELAGEELSAFEQDLQADKTLRSCYDDAARMDRLLRAALPDLDQDENFIDDLAEQALENWEQTYVPDQQFAEEPPGNLKRDGHQSRWYGLFSHPALGLVGLAAAAIIMLVSPVLTTPDGLVWDEPVFTSLTMRGTLPSNEPGTLTDDIAVRCRNLLQAEMVRVLTESGREVPPMSVSLHIQELRYGAFSLALEIRTRQGETVGLWRGDYSGEDAFREEVGSSVAHIAEALISWSDTENGGQP